MNALVSKPSDVGVLSFEDALKELETLVHSLEKGGFSLNEAIGAYERGKNLCKHAEKILEEARLRINEITEGPDGALSLTPSPLEKTF